MEIGIFSVSDVTPDPTTGIEPTENDRIRGIVEIAKHAEEVGLDVVALGEHHNPPFFSSSPTTTLAWIGAQTERIKLSTATTLITTDDPVKIAEDFAMLQHLANGRVDIMLGRGNTGPVYPWFGKDIREGGLNLAVENYALLHRLWREDVVDWEGKFRTPLQGFTSTPPRPLDGVPPRSCGTARSAPPRRSPSRPRTTATASSTTTSSGRCGTPSRWCSCTGGASSTTVTAAPTRRSSASADSSSCARTPRTPCASSGPTSMSRRSTATARRWRTSPRRPR